MGTAETVAALAAFDRRGAGTNAERRAANALAAKLSGPRRETTVETFWCRPNSALAQAWHTALALAGSLVSVASPAAGIAMIAVALSSLATDALTGISPGRRLTREHASQNVTSRATGERPPATLIVTANYDAGRMGLVYRRPLRTAASLARRALGDCAPGWLGWLALTFAWVLVTVIARSGSSPGLALEILQFIPTAGLVLALAALLELGAAPFGPAAADNATGVAVAIALARAVDASPPHSLAVDVVLQGAGDGAMAGLRSHLRNSAGDVTVLALASCGAGTPRWWISDGPLLPVRTSRRLQRIAAAVAGRHGGPHRGRGTSPAYPALLRRLPAITIGCLDDHGLAPRSHQPSDTADAIDRAAVDGLLELALTLVDTLDIELWRTPNRGPAAAS